MAATLVRHRFSVDDYEQMIEKGILTEDDRVELIRGEIIDKISIGDEHAACVSRLNRLFNRTLGDAAIVRIQDPVRLEDSAPEPDIALVKPRQDFYASGHPRSADVLLVVEVADTSLETDRDVKRPLYAENGIVEYWIVNLAETCIEVHRQPRPDGSYQDVRTLRRGQTIDVAALPGCAFPVDQVF
jgi:Uma2 family endonuclease